MKIIIALALLSASSFAQVAEPPQEIQKVTIALWQPAYVDMPVWLRVNLPADRGTIEYPYVVGRAGFGCNWVEVRQNGRPLTIRPESNWYGNMIIVVGNICGSFGSPSDQYGERVPLHLLYRFAEPGVYEVRFTQRDLPMGGSLEASRTLSQSEWTTIEVLPSKPGQRAEWLRSVSANLPTDPAEILSDTLPSVLGVPDEASWQIVSRYLEHPDTAVQTLAKRGLAFWPEKTKKPE